MPGISIQIDSRDFDKALKALRPLLDFEPEELMSTIGALGEMQTRRRITEEKTAPDGTAWAPNIEGTPILVRTGEHLLYSMAWTASAHEAEWGAGWEYAHVHQEGATIKPKSAKALFFNIGGNTVAAKSVTIPARPFLGISPENEAEILDVVSDHFGLAQ